MKTIIFNPEKIKQLAKKKNITNKTLYDALEMSKQNFDYVLKTGKLKCSNLATICVLLDCKPNDLFDISENYTITLDNEVISD